MNTIIVYDSDHPGAVQNKCFKPSYASEGPGHSFTVELARIALLKGYEILTADEFLKREKQTSSRVLCITEMQSLNTTSLLKKGVIPFLCFSTESPIIARDFYTDIKSLAGRFIFNIQFRGTAERLAKTSTQFTEMYFPIDGRIPLPLFDWKEKDFLVLVNRNKRMFYSDYSSLKNIVRSILSPIKIAIKKIQDPWIRSKEIYKDRIEAIYHFSNNKGFYLYGHGWERKIPGFSVDYYHAANKVYYGSLETEKKLSTMNKFKFSICFENCVFPGYVTEKIFDCFLAGCIPVYYGAPDIEDFVPAASFVDYRKFKNYTELDNYLSKMSEVDALSMIESARQFLSGENFDKYYYKNVVDKIFSMMSHYIDGSNLS